MLRISLDACGSKKIVGLFLGSQEYRCSLFLVVLSRPGGKELAQWKCGYPALVTSMLPANQLLNALLTFC